MRWPKYILITIILFSLTSCKNTDNNNKYSPQSSISPSLPENKNNIPSSNIKLPETSKKTVGGHAYYKIDLPYSHTSKIAKLNNTLYIPINQNDENLADSIISYNIETKSTDLIYTSSLEKPAINDLSVNENWLIWSESTEIGTDTVFYYMSLKTHQIKEAVRYNNSQTSIDSPFLYENNIFWINKQNSSKPVLEMYNLNNKKRRVISELNTVSFFNNALDIKENKVLWTDSKNGEGYYKIYNIQANTILNYKSTSPFPGYAKQIGNEFVSINFKDYHNWVNQKFGSFNSSNNSFEIIEDGYINKFDAYKNTVAYINQKQELILYDFSTRKKNNISTEIQTTVDNLDFMSDGTLIATTFDIKNKLNKLFIFSTS